MNPQLESDLTNFPAVLELALAHATRYLSSLPSRPVAQASEPAVHHRLPETGLGAPNALRQFQEAFEPQLSASPGPRYFGFVTGGSTPASVAGDWLTAAYDQSVSLAISSVAAAIECEALDLLRDLLELPSDFTPCAVTGATMANFVALATARQWIGRQRSVDVAEDGLNFPITVFSATPHITAIKALAMLGLGRSSCRPIPTLPGREAMDPQALRVALQQQQNTPSIVIASAGTVNTGDFDDFTEIASLCRESNAWLHVDAAFGLYAACSPETAHLLKGIHLADSITADCHKWLNVPYDCGVQFTRHFALQREVFRTMAAYLGNDSSSRTDHANSTPETSQRFRGLAMWLTLMAYGRAGYRDIIERNCHFAAKLGAFVERSSLFELLAPVRLNIVCFRLSDAVLAGRDQKSVTTEFLARLSSDGRVFMTPASYAGHHGLRAAISNWSTTQKDLQITIAALEEVARYTAK